MLCCSRAGAVGTVNRRRRQTKHQNRTRFRRKVSSARSTTRCTCVLATVATATAPAAAATPTARPSTSRRILRGRRRPVAKATVSMTTKLQRRRQQLRSAASAAAAATPSWVQGRMLAPPSPGPAHWDLQRGVEDCGSQRRRRRLVQRIDERRAASNRTNTHTFGRCRFPRPASSSARVLTLNCQCFSMRGSKQNVQF